MSDEKGKVHNFGDKLLPSYTLASMLEEVHKFQCVAVVALDPSRTEMPWVAISNCSGPELLMMAAALQHEAIRQVAKLKAKKP